MRTALQYIPGKGQKVFMKRFQMTKEKYLKISEPYRASEALRNQLVRMNRLLTGIAYISYALVVFYWVLRWNKEIAAVILVPAIGFLLVTAFRRIMNRPRPYEVWEIEPLIEKDTKGKSFPSRHVFSMFMVATAVGKYFVAAGAALMVAGAILAMIRVIAGVHFVRDVVLGAILGVGLGVAGFFIAAIWI